MNYLMLNSEWSLVEYQIARNSAMSLSNRLGDSPSLSALSSYSYSVCSVFDVLHLPGIPGRFSFLQGIKKQTSLRVPGC